MNEFRVYDIKNQEMLYNNFFLDQEGKLYKNNQENGLLEYCEKENYIIMHSIDREDISTMKIFEKDILRYETGYEFFVAFGEHTSFCPGDQMMTTNQGFVAVRFEDNKPDYSEVYPLSHVEYLAKVVGYYINGVTTYLPEDEVIVSSDIEAELQEALEKNNKNFMSYIMPSSVIECLDTKNTVVVDIKNEINGIERNKD